MSPAGNLLSAGGRFLTGRVTPAMWQTGLLTSVDMVTNLTDYLFHIYLGWALVPGDFAIVQTVNAALLIVVAAVGVMQPVVARYLAVSGNGQPAAPLDAAERGLFQTFFRQSVFLGVLALAVILILREWLAQWLNVPVVAVVLAGGMVLISLLRPVVAGVLQGRHRFVAFGATRATFALGRLSLAILLLGVFAGGALAGVATLPLGALLALVVGLLFLGREVWQRGTPAASSVVWAGWRLSLAALVAYTAYMALQGLDLIWVNRVFPGVPAGGYATAVTLRRIPAVLPGAVLVILYPRIVATVKSGRLPDRLLMKAGAVITASNLLITTLFFVAGPLIVRLMFGVEYAAAGPLLGWMGVAMCGFGIGAIWLNLFLATRPWPFVLWLALVVGGQLWLLSAWPGNLFQVAQVFIISGWLVALGGLVLYLVRLRPQLKHRNGLHE